MAPPEQHPDPAPLPGESPDSPDEQPSARQAGQQPDPSPEAEAAPLPLLALSEPLPDVAATDAAVAAVARRLSEGTGPVAVDAERASGYRYSQRAYLVQLRREGSGTALVDPAAGADLAPLQEVLRGPEWILHAASQDLPCLTELDLAPDRLFDTELAARLLGYPRVGLATMVEELLGRRLRKEHSAVDWSTRPLPQPWLEYAALDVEPLAELRELLHAALMEAGKWEWAHQEFEHVRTLPPAPPRLDPWRRTSGLHRVRGRRALAAVRALWETRDRIAEERDVTPGRILADSALVAAAVAAPRSRDELLGLDGFRGRGARRYAREWLAALQEARALPESALPPAGARYDGPPPPRAWADRNPSAAARLTQARTALSALADELALPLENLLTPDTLRRVLWEPPAGDADVEVPKALATLGARPWQVGLVTEHVVAAVRDHPG